MKMFTMWLVIDFHNTLSYENIIFAFCKRPFSSFESCAIIFIDSWVFHPFPDARYRNPSTLPRIRLHRTLTRSHVGSWFRHCRLLRRKICNLPYDIIFFAVHTTAGFILTLHELPGIRRAQWKQNWNCCAMSQQFFVVIISFERNSFWAGEEGKKTGLGWKNDGTFSKSVSTRKSRPEMEIRWENF